MVPLREQPLRSGFTRKSLHGFSQFESKKDVAMHGPPIMGRIGFDLLLNSLGWLQGPSLDKD